MNGRISRRWLGWAAIFVAVPLAVHGWFESAGLRRDAFASEPAREAAIGGGKAGSGMTGQLTAAPGADAPGGSGSRTADGSRPARESRPAVAWPLVTLLVGIAAVLGLIIGLKANAFMALVTAAMVVSLMAGGPASERISRVAAAFGESAGKIGVVIALAAVIGKCMLDSGAADRIVRGFLRLFGQRRAPLALMGSGFVLGIPVFFDTVFYLLIPLARSLYRKTGRNFLLYVLAIGAGGAITHTLVPPTPGPLVMASNLDFPVGILIMVGLVVAAPAAVAGLLFAGLANRRMPIPMRPVGSEPEPDPLEDSQLPSLGLSLAPVVLPVVLISANTVFAMWAKGPGSAAWVKSIADVAAIVGDANLALLVATVIALGTLALKRGLNRGQLAHVAEVALTSGGVIILITAAGGAFGAMLKVAEVGPAIQYVFSGVGATGLMIIVLGFSIGAVLKIAQGSSTVAMITGTAMLAGIASSGSLGFHPVYLATAIGAGSLVGSWMNDSGFWIVAKMSGLTEGEALKSWTAMLVVLAFTGLLATMALASVMPYPPFTVAPLAD